ncbi:MAG TPA: glycosyltransferase family 2 protein [Chromatiales bacterium]|nr:glycosyltransferase family 2 protein [Chromatiales bacterium]
MAEQRLTRQPRGDTIAVMVVWNGRRFLERAVGSVLAELDDRDDLLVVDNGSTDGSFEFLQQHFPQVAVLETGDNLGGAGGFSAGMRVALQDPGCRQVWLLDNDIEVEPGALGALQAVLDDDPAVAAAGSQLCLYDDPMQIQEIGSRYTPWLGALQQLHHGEHRLPPETPPLVADYLPACSLLVRREIVERIGPFREEFFIFYDDVEWSLRAGATGGVLKGVPGSVVRHCYGGSKETVPWREYYRKRNRCACLDLHPPPYGGRLALLLYLGYLNYRIRFLQRQGDGLLAQIYRQARDDFLARRFGRRDDLPEATPTSPPPALSGTSSVRVDASLTPGDATAACQALGVAPGDNRHAENLIAGECYSWKAAGARRLWRYRCGGRWQAVTSPRLEYLRTRARTLSALLAAMPAAVQQWRSLRR